MKVVVAGTADTIRRPPLIALSDIVSGLAILVRSHFSSTTQPAAHAACLSWFGSAMPHIHALGLGSGRRFVEHVGGRCRSVVS